MRTLEENPKCLKAHTRPGNDMKLILTSCNEIAKVWSWDLEASDDAEASVKAARGSWRQKLKDNNEKLKWADSKENNMEIQQLELLKDERHVS